MTMELPVPGARVVADEMAPRCSVPGCVLSPLMATSTVSAAVPVLCPVVAALQLSTVFCVLPAELACALLARGGALSLLACSPQSALAAASAAEPKRADTAAASYSSATEPEHADTARRCLLFRH